MPVDCLIFWKNACGSQDTVHACSCSLARHQWDSLLSVLAPTLFVPMHTHARCRRLAAFAQVLHTGSCCFGPGLWSAKRMLLQQHRLASTMKSVRATVTHS